MKDVHTEHCCIIHGCKYCDDDCTVVTRKAPQSYPCEDCEGIYPMFTLYLLRGLPGCGKTTLAEQLTADDHGVMLAADDFFTNEYTGEYTFDPSKLGQAHEQCRQRCETSMRNEVERIVVHNTFTTKKEMKPYYELAKKHGYMVQSLIVENRHGGKNTHDVPEHALERMEQRFDIKLR